ncbi:GDSL-type esterase/lipase family protein [Phormidesmis priestleyi]
MCQYNLGIRRETSTELAKRWLSEVQRRLSDDCDGRVVFSFGVKDTTIAQSRRVELSDSLENMRQILSVARSLFPVLMIGPPPIADVQQNLRIAELSEQMATVSQSLGVPYLEMFSRLKDSQIWASEVVENDGAHPRQAGYAEFAAIVQNWSAWSAWYD